MKIVFTYVNKFSSNIQKTNTRIMIDSVRQSIPGATIIQLSDEQTTSEFPIDEIIRLAAQKFLIPTRIDYFHEYLNKYCEDGDEVIFVDSNIIVQKDLFAVFDEKVFDVGVISSAGEYKQAMPYNTNIMYVNNNRVSQQIFFEYDTAIQQASESSKKWFGDKLALKKIVDEGVNLTLLDNKYDYFVSSAEIIRLKHKSEICKTQERIGSQFALAFGNGLEMVMEDFHISLTN